MKLKWNFRIKTKIYLFFGVCLALIFSSLTLFVVMVMKPEAVESASFTISQINESTAQEVNAWVGKKALEYRLISAIPAFSSMDVREITPLIQRFTDLYKRNGEIMETFTYIGKNGFCWINNEAAEELMDYKDYRMAYESAAIVGDGLQMAREAGANLIGMGDIQLYPINNPATGNYYFMDYARLNSNALLVNRNGQRFVDEKGTRDRLAEAILRQPDAKVYELIDSQVVQEMNLEYLYEGEIARCLDQGVLVRGSLEECCKFFDLPQEALKNTIMRFNGFAERGEDEDFGRTNNLEKIGDGPYYLFLCVVSVHHTMGGVEIDREARVLDTSGNIIAGLYGAGEVTGGIHGENRLGSMSMPDTVTFGRIAARSARMEK